MSTNGNVVWDNGRGWHDGPAVKVTVDGHGRITATRGDETTATGGYVATINTPGYLPWADEPAVFETAAEAWAYLASERVDLEDSAFDAGLVTDENYSDDYERLNATSSWHNAAGHICGPDECTGTVYADTPGYDGDHDLGLAYSVTYDPDATIDNN